MGKTSAVDPTPRPAVPGTSTSSSSRQVRRRSPRRWGIDGPLDAAETIGWQVDMYDAELNPSNYHAAGAASDRCRRRRDPARCHRLPSGRGPVHSTKHERPGSRSSGQARSTATTLTAEAPTKACIQPRVTTSVRWPRARPRSPAATAPTRRATSSPSPTTRAKILALQDPEFTTLYYTYDGFQEANQKQSHGSKIVERARGHDRRLRERGTLVTKIQAELLRHPDVDWIKSRFTFATTLGIVPALGGQPGRHRRHGRRGARAPSSTWCREGKTTAVNIFPTEWFGVGFDRHAQQRLPRRATGRERGRVDADRPARTSGRPRARPRSQTDYTAQYRKAWGTTG